MLLLSKSGLLPARTPALAETKSDLQRHLVATTSALSTLPEQTQHRTHCQKETRLPSPSKKMKGAEPRGPETLAQPPITTPRNLPDSLEPLCTMNALEPSLKKWMNFFTFVLCTNASTLNLIHSKHSFPINTTWGKPLLLSSNRRTEAPSTTENSKVFAST